MLIEKVAKMALLFDFYGQLLTDKQQEFFKLYYEDDLSLGEIAEEYQISRQAVHDLLKRSEKILVEYEDKLGLVQKHLERQEQIQHIHNLISRYKESADTKLLDEVDQHLATLLQDRKAEN